MTQTPEPDENDQERADDVSQEAAQDDGGGEVSEVSTMAGAAEPIQPDQSVAGSPNDEAGGVDEGAQGPNANPNAGASRT